MKVPNPNPYAGGLVPSLLCLGEDVSVHWSPWSPWPDPSQVTSCLGALPLGSGGSDSRRHQEPSLPTGSALQMPSSQISAQEVA